MQPCQQKHTAQPLQSWIPQDIQVQPTILQHKGWLAEESLAQVTEENTGNCHPNITATHNLMRIAFDCTTHKLILIVKMWQLIS